MRLMAEGSSAATLSASTPLATRESMGSPSRPTTTTASTPLERLSASTTSRMVAIRAGNLGFRQVEVKQRLWVDPLEHGPVSCPHSMRYFILALLGCAGAAACGNPFRSEEHTSELQSRENLVCRLL